MDIIPYRQRACRIVTLHNFVWMVPKHSSSPSISPIDGYSKLTSYQRRSRHLNRPMCRLHKTARALRASTVGYRVTILQTTQMYETRVRPQRCIGRNLHPVGDSGNAQPHVLIIMQLSEAVPSAIGTGHKKSLNVALLCHELHPQAPRPNQAHY